MNVFTLDELVDMGRTHAHQTLITNREKQLMTIYHLVTPGDEPDLIVPVHWSNDMQKQLAIAGVRGVAHQKKATALMVVSECWIVEMPANADLLSLIDSQPRPSQHPNRYEAVSIFATDGTDTASLTLRIKRNKGGRIIALDQQGDVLRGATSIMGQMIDGILPPTKTTTRH